MMPDVSIEALHNPEDLDFINPNFRNSGYTLTYTGGVKLKY
jgi:hypothetical protein